jgi:hypothetical protein
MIQLFFFICIWATLLASLLILARRPNKLPKVPELLTGVLKNLLEHWPRETKEIDRAIEAVREVRRSLTEARTHEFSLQEEFKAAFRLASILARLNIHRLYTYGPGSMVLRPPGSSLARIAEFLCREKVYRDIAAPAIADMQHEYFDALDSKRRVKAAWVRVRGTWSVFHALGLDRVLRAVSSLLLQPRQPR